MEMTLILYFFLLILIKVVPSTHHCLINFFALYYMKHIRGYLEPIKEAYITSIREPEAVLRTERVDELLELQFGKTNGMRLLESIMTSTVEKID